MNQLSLFDTGNRTLKNSATPDLKMSRDFLLNWKQRIFKYQDSIRQQHIHQELPSQSSLIELPQRTWTKAEDIDPFSLRRHSSTFWRLKEHPEPVDDINQGCLYFIIDHHLPILLYVGETKLTYSKRWKNTHYCKDYILNYIELNRQYDLEIMVGSSFYYHIPPEKDFLLQGESHLIHKWRSPFNKEMWQYYGQPFKKIG